MKQQEWTMKIVATLLALFILISAQAQQKEGAQYFDQTSPGMTSQVFAPGIVSIEGQSEFGSIYSKDGSEFYYAVDQPNGKAELRIMKRSKEKWSNPDVLLSHDTYSYNDPFLSPDEQRLYFISNQPLSGVGPKKDFDIWYIERSRTGWSKPINAGPNINTNQNEYYICITKNGTMYYSSNGRASQIGKDDYDVYMAKSNKGGFQKSVRLDAPVNTESYEGDVFVAPDESYLIVCSDRPGGFGAGDLYISFKNRDGSWGQLKNMGKEINEDRFQYCPIVTQDEKFLLFTSKDDIRWIDANVIDKLRK